MLFESFQKIPRTNISNFDNRNWTGDGGLLWQAKQSRLDIASDGSAITFRQGGEVISPVVSGGLGTLRFRYHRTSTEDAALIILINNVKVDMILADTPADTSTTPYKTSVYEKEFNVDGDVQVTLRGYDNQITIDSLNWDNYPNKGAIDDGILNAEVGGEESNSYITVFEADNYFSTRLNTTIWDTASLPIKKKAIIMATGMIDMLPFRGYIRQSSTQALQFPRYPEVNDPYMLGIPHLTTVKNGYKLWVNIKGVPIIPKDLKSATAEQAFFLIRTIRGIDKRDALRGQGIDQVRYNNVTEKLANTNQLCAPCLRYLNKLNAIKSGYGISR